MIKRGSMIAVRASGPIFNLYNDIRVKSLNTWQACLPMGDITFDAYIIQLFGGAWKMREELLEIIGDEKRVITGNIDSKYLSDNLGRKHGSAAALVFPTSTEEVSLPMKTLSP